MGGGGSQEEAITIGRGTPVMEFCSGGRHLGSTPKESYVGNWECVAKGQGESRWMENY